MVDSVRVALRFLPAVRPSIAGASGAWSRAPKAKRVLSENPSETLQIHHQQVVNCEKGLVGLKVNPLTINCEKAQQGETGVFGFARAVLYTGAGISAVTSNQLSCSSNLQAKEIKPTVGGNQGASGTEEAGGMWQRSSANRHGVPDDAIRSQMFAHCPRPHVASKSQPDVVGHSYYWGSSSWCSVDSRYCPETKLDSQWQFSPSTHRDHRSKLGGLDEGLSYYWGSSWGSVDPRFSPDVKVDSQWQFSPSSTYWDYRPKLGGLDEGLNTRFSKPTGLQEALGAEGNLCTKSSAGGTNTMSECNAAAELQLVQEWQLIVDPKAKSGLKATTCDTKACGEDEKTTYESEAIGSGSKQDDQAKIKWVMNTCYVGTSEMMKKSSKDIMTKSSKVIMTKTSKDIIPKSSDTGYEYNSGAGAPQHQNMGSSSSTHESLLWRVPDRETPAGLFAQKAPEHMDDCTPLSLTSFDILASVEKHADTVRSLDKNLFSSLLLDQEVETTPPESFALPSSSAVLLGTPVQFHRVSQPLCIPSAEGDRRSTGWPCGAGASSYTTERGSDSGLLGAALCHSQTRAREAEQKVQEVYEEKERLLRLFFREASLSLTYRQWVASLQAENMWLRMYGPHEPLAWFDSLVLRNHPAWMRRASNSMQFRVHISRNFLLMLGFLTLGSVVILL